MRLPHNDLKVRPRIVGGRDDERPGFIILAMQRGAALIDSVEREVGG
jgi:hypothetical protein